MKQNPFIIADDKATDSINLLEAGFYNAAKENAAGLTYIQLAFASMDLKRPKELAKLQALFLLGEITFEWYKNATIAYAILK